MQTNPVTSVLATVAASHYQSVLEDYPPITRHLALALVLVTVTLLTTFALLPAVRLILSFCIRWSKLKLDQAIRAVQTFKCYCHRRLRSSIKRFYKLFILLLSFINFLAFLQEVLPNPVSVWMAMYRFSNTHIPWSAGHIIKSVILTFTMITFIIYAAYRTFAPPLYFLKAVIVSIKNFYIASSATANTTVQWLPYIAGPCVALYVAIRLYSWALRLNAKMAECRVRISTWISTTASARTDVEELSVDPLILSSERVLDPGLPSTGTLTEQPVDSLCTTTESVSEQRMGSRLILTETSKRQVSIGDPGEIRQRRTASQT